MFLEKAFHRLSFMLSDLIYMDTERYRTTVTDPVFKKTMYHSQAGSAGSDVTQKSQNILHESLPSLQE